ncbi:uncharacterized protein LOC118916214 [Manis pentadactyla]|uniref:uncharacterized protein LOC118916214 n=1 Tax=Manis pentadactyla TaxID=143292 RepID=UPI00255C4A41|nr:uncharacterized protein LOC118916214 [Manis pentadactyla]
MQPGIPSRGGCERTCRFQENVVPPPTTPVVSVKGELSFPSGAAADSPRSGFPGLRAGLNRAAAVVVGTGWEWWRQCPVSGKVSVKIRHLHLPPDICESGYPVFPAVLQAATAVGGVRDSVRGTEVIAGPAAPAPGTAAGTTG